MRVSVVRAARVNISRSGGCSYGEVAEAGADAGRRTAVLQNEAGADQFERSQGVARGAA